MFHLFTIQGKRLDLPLENLKGDLRINRVATKSRSRKLLKDEYRQADTRQSGRDGVNREAIEAYRHSSGRENIKEKVYQASEIMNSPVITIEPHVTAAEAWRKFEKEGVRHMPVLSENGEIIGVLAERDVIQQLIIRKGEVEDSGEDLPIKDIMSREVIATGPQTDIRRIARALLEQDIGLMPVVGENNNLLGVVTPSDILHAIIHHPGLSLWA